VQADLALRASTVWGAWSSWVLEIYVSRDYQYWAKVVSIVVVIYVRYKKPDKY
jgi:hypothetical protein